jgi:hypothetical protein
MSPLTYGLSLGQEGETWLFWLTPARSRSRPADTRGRPFGGLPPVLILSAPGCSAPSSSSPEIFPSHCLVPGGRGNLACLGLRQNKHAGAAYAKLAAVTQSDPIPHPELEADCTRCFGLCCTALSFARTDGFGHDKPEGVHCHFLAGDYRCSIHPRREALGYEGCIDFTCLGAGQRASKQFVAANWRRDLAIARQLFARFARLLKLQEMRQALMEAEEMDIGEEKEQERRQLLTEIAKSADGEGDSGEDVEMLLRRGEELIRTMKEAG